MDPAIDRARRLIDGADTVVGFTGAGVSTASGIPDFRGPDGLWSRFDPEEFYYQRFLDDPKRFWTLRAKLTRELKLDQAEPNACHNAMADAVNGDRMAAIVTQNIDGLHQQAGTPDGKVLEVHGTTRWARCIECRRRVPIEAAVDQVGSGRVPPECDTCSGVLKPDVVLFGEMLPVDVFRRAERHAADADVMLVAGSSLSVWPAAGLPQTTLEHGGVLVIVNGDATTMDDDAEVVVRGRVEEAVPAVLGQ